MYPLKEGMFAPRNQWYIAAWAQEITRAPLERHILDELIVFYRTEDGRAVALDGRCPHRSFPLGKGLLHGDNIECGYHGMTFRPDGSCSSIPSQASVPRTCRIKSYAVAERWQFVWIWPGDPELADESLIPDHDALGLTNPAHECVSGIYRHVEGRYTLMHDNLLDLTHIGFLHRNTFGGGTGAATIVPEHDTGLGWVESKFNLEGIDIPEFGKPIFQFEGVVNRRFGLRFHAPCLHAGSENFYKVNEDGSDGERLGSILLYHAITPETKHSCHYFVSFGFDLTKPIPGLVEKLAGSGGTDGLIEDIYATTEIEKMIQAHDDRPSELLFRADAVCVLGRRILENMIRAETGDESVTEEELA